MAEKKDSLRIPFNLNLDNPEHKKVYDIIQRQENRNAFIRKAILLYGETVSRDNGTLLLEFRRIIQEENRDMYLHLLDLFMQEDKNQPKIEQSASEVASEPQAQEELDFEKIKNMF